MAKLKVGPSLTWGRETSVFENKKPNECSFFLMEVVVLEGLSKPLGGSFSYLNSQFDILKVTKAFGGKEEGGLQMSSSLHGSIWRLRPQVLQQVGASCHLEAHVHAEPRLIGQQEIKEGFL